MTAETVMHGRELSLMMLRAWCAGDSLAEIGERFGMSKQAVHGRVNRIASAADKRQAKRAAVRRRQRERAAEQEAERARLVAEAEAADRRCPICGRLVLNPKRRTDTEKCAAAWEVARRSIDAEAKEAHRRSQARVILRRPEGRTEAQVEWARAMLSDNPPPPNRRYVQRGSRVAEVVAAVRG